MAVEIMGSSDISTKESLELKHCNGCDKDLPATTDYFYISYLDKKKGRPKCKKCHTERKKNLELFRNRRKSSSAQRELLIIGTPAQCGSCGTEVGNIVGDVEVTEGRKYGYLCMKCYHLVRESRRDLTRLRNVLSYVEQTEKSCAK